MRYHMLTIATYLDAAPHLAKRVVVNTKDKVVEHKSELACIGGTAVAVGLTARVAGFKAGYEFAKSNTSS